MGGIELKPCPFCGGVAEVVVDSETEMLFIIQCTECKAQTTGYENLYSAEYDWNRRVENGKM